jgi:flavin reductase (DIM6/NTAB) family NADH-FMN oxidoreductase RutF
VPVLEGVVAWLVCRVVARVPAGDHRVVLAEVELGESIDGARPLLYHRGRFNALRD